MSLSLSLKTKVISSSLLLFYSSNFLISCGDTITSDPPITQIVSNDFNGDGIADILVGTGAEDSGGSGAGAVYLFYGSAGLTSTVDASAANVKLIGQIADDLFGDAATGGDVNNDGIADIIVGATGDDTGGFGAGAVYIFYGSKTLPSSIDADNANVKLVGEDAGDQFGTSITAADVNGDGIADIIVGAISDDSGGSAAGAAYIFYGSTSLASSIDASSANVKMIGENANDNLGGSVGSGDINNNGFNDIIVGATEEDAGGASAGAAYIFFGSASLAATIDASAANSKLIGEAAGDNLGTGIASGDVNNDGFDDSIIGAQGEGSGGASAGAVYIFYGATSITTPIDASAANVKITGEDAGDLLGESVASGDVNNDGIADIIAGARSDDTGGSGAGAVYFIYGSTTLAASIDASAANVKFFGEAAGDFLGDSVNASGDVNSDGIADLITGATAEDSGGSNAGAAYILYGSASLAASIDASIANMKIIGEVEFDNLGRSVLN